MGLNWEFGKRTDTPRPKVAHMLNACVWRANEFAKSQYCLARIYVDTDVPGHTCVLRVCLCTLVSACGFRYAS